MRWLNPRFILLGLVGFVLALAVSLAALRDSTEVLTAEALHAARKRWADSGIQDYRIKYVVNGDEYAVTCRAGIVTEVIVNGQRPLAAAWRFHGVMGLFDILERDLDNLSDPAGPFAVSGKTMFLKARFQRELGYLEKYIRSSGGSGRGASIEMISFSAGRSR